MTRCYMIFCQYAVPPKWGGSKSRSRDDDTSSVRCHGLRVYETKSTANVRERVTVRNRNFAINDRLPVELIDVGKQFGDMYKTWK